MSKQVRNKIGFHFGSQSTASGWGDYVRRLDDAGIPAVLMSVGGEGFGDIAAVWDGGSTVDHLAVIRCLSANDVPLYGIPIETAVNDWLNRYVPTIGADVKKYHSRVITKHGNELDKNRIQWLADFYTALHPALLARMGWASHRIACFSFAAGEPEPEQWETIRPFIELAGNNPDKFVFSLHEYSYDVNDIMAGNGWQVGRFQKLYDYCDASGIKRPCVVSHEWGWEENEMPTTDQAMADIDQIAALYAQYETYLGAGIWTLQKWHETNYLSNKVQKLIQPVTDLTLNVTYPCCNEPTGEEDMTPKDCDLYLDLGRFIHLLPQDTTDDEIAAIARKFNASKHSFVFSHDDAELIVAHGRGQNSEGKRVSEVKIWEPQRFSFDVTGYFASKGYMYTVGYFAGEPEPSNPLTGLKLGYLFEYQYSDNYSPFNAPRDYDGDGIFDDRHEGLDADVIGGNVDNRVNVLCVYDGTVDRSLDSTGNYGKYVRIAHVRNGSTFYTRYCHLDTRLVQVGVVIKKGDPVGEVGDTGYVSGEHVHFNIEVPGYGLSGYVVADVVDPYPYLPKDNMSLPPVGSTPSPSQTVDTLRYFVPSGQYGRKIVMRVGNGTQPMQLEKRANDVILRKGDGNWINGIRYQDSEQWRVVNGQVQKGIDTSDAGNGGRDAYDLAWAQWIPQHVEVGKTYHSTPTVRRFDRTTCATISSIPASDYLYIKALVPQWTSPANASIVLSNVLIIEWRSGTPDLSVPPTETYYFCKEIGYVGWGSHFINELADGQAPLTGKLDCAQ